MWAIIIKSKCCFQENPTLYSILCHTTKQFRILSFWVRLDQCQGWLPEFLPKPGIIRVQVGVERDVLLQVLFHLLNFRQFSLDNDDDPLCLVLESLGVGRPELQLGPHGLDVGLAEDDDGPPAGLHTVHDLVRDHLASLPVPSVDQTLVLLTAVLWTLQA